MNVDFQSWMRAVWLSLIEPADIARTALTRTYPAQALWLATALIAVLNVLLLVLVQMIVTMPDDAPTNAAYWSPFGLTGLIGMLLVLMVYAIFYAGRALDGQGSLHGTLTLMVWFHAVSFTLEALQVPLLLISPYMGALFGMIVLGGLLWCILNFIDVLHGFQSLGKAFITLVMAMIGMGLIGGLILAMLGIAPGGTV